MVTEHAPVVYGKYRLMDLLARGGMAEVFKAKSHGVEGFEKILVVKRILAELSENPEFVEMFINEAKIAVTLSHANIVQVFDLGLADETYFIAMEYVAGYDLATVLRRGRKYGKPLPPELAVYVVSEVAKGLDYAHRRRDADMQPLGIVHRDVSPQNVLLSYEGEVKLTDFGIAKARTSVADGTESGVLKGKYAYMSPEQARGKDVDGRTDIFALGTVLYEALAGSNPFLTASTYETLQRVREGHVAPIRENARHVPEELAVIVDQAMRLDPDERHENAGRFYEDLVQFLYASGRRVGAHDLSNYLDGLRVASAGRRSSPDAEGELRAAFDAGTGAAMLDSHELTPAEVPSARSEAGRVTTGSGRRPTPRAERRDLTVLAVHAGDVSREDLARALTLAGATVRDGGDVSLAIFGIQDPDGRDTEMAARAALVLVKRDPAARVGIHAGPVVVADAGVLEDEASESLFATATSLADDARPGVPLASEPAERAGRRHFEFAPDGEETFELVSEKDLAESLGKFVGRRDELRRVGEVLAVASKGSQCLVSLVGDAGSGKSRLLQETVRRLRLGGHDVAMHVARLPPRSRATPLSGIQAMLRVILGLEEFTQEAEIRDKLERLRELGLGRPDIDAISNALGVTATSEAPLVQAVSRMASKLAEDRLSVFAFDDFDGVDPESLALLQRLAREPSAGRIVLLCAFRSHAPFVFDGFPGHVEVRLGPLADDDIARLVGERLGSDEVPMELLREVSLKSTGNPLYVEEYLLALQDAGAIQVHDGKIVYKSGAGVEVPKSLRGIVSARLSRLSDDERHLLRIAAIIGGRFHDVMIARVAGRSRESVGEQLLGLVDKGILLSSGDEYGFAHGVLPIAVIAGIPLEARRELHEAVAETFVQVYPKHLDDLAERLARHYREAGNRGRAIDFLVRAADRMEAEHAHAAAVANLSTAVEMIGKAAKPDRERALQLYRRMGDLCFQSRDLETGIAKMDSALELAEGLGREEHVARFSLARGQFLARANRFVDAKPWFERARNVARRVGDSELLGAIVRTDAEATARNGDYQSAIGLLKEALALSRDVGDVKVQLSVLAPLALAYGGSGNQEAAFAALADARRLVDEDVDRFTETELWKTESLVCFFTGDLPRALEAAERALELAKEYGFPYEASVNAHNMGETHMRLGDYKRAFALLRYSHDVAREHGFTKLQYNNMRVLGFIDAVKLKSPEGRDRIIEALEHAIEQNYVWDIIQGRHMLAIVDHVEGRIDEAKRGFAEVLQLSSENGQRHYQSAAEQALQAIQEGRPVPLHQ